ncbi:hypothetical protein BC833DRAFT_576601 [Globomyces pollinis-pini]|nr:hypothetical protein BC833DRAFT_576601 [Globomyces pollinis-pini]
MYITSITRSTGSPSQPMLSYPPPMPKNWPVLNQLVKIDGDFLKDPLITEAMTYIQSVVPQSLLSIPPSTQILGNNVRYNSDPIKNCYWPASGCTRLADTEFYKADYVKCPNDNDWGLTYDDGPSLATGNSSFDTSKIVTALSKQNLKATFFVVGINTMINQKELQATKLIGHQIGHHTWSHHPLTSLTNEQIVAEIKYTEAIIYKTIGVVPRHFRPPYGDVDDRVRAIVTALGYRNIFWTTTAPQIRDSKDTVPPNRTESAITFVQNNVLSWLYPQPGFISLQHDINTFTSKVAVKVLEKIPSNSVLKLQPVGSCLGLAEKDWYVNEDAISKPP